jgi:hypothetical protein
MPELTEIERKILLALDGDGGRKTGTVARDVDALKWAGFAGRSFSLEIGSQLKALMDRGFVSHLDAQKPVCWLRTPAGTAALAAQQCLLDAEKKMESANVGR